MIVIRGCGFGAPVYASDSFTRADAASSLGDTDSYAGGTTKTWVQRSGTWGITSNRAYAPAAGEARATVDVSASDVRVEANLYVVSTASRWDGGLAARYDASTSGFGTGLLFATYNSKAPDTNKAELYVCISGTPTLRASVTSPIYSSGADTAIFLQVVGSVVTVGVGASTATYTLTGGEASALTGTNVGMRHNEPAIFTNFRWSDWVCRGAS